ncbi:unnamed protein product [Gemmata massiliana]|uniref:Uncharacterized protein n=1 Tax=Gemmata massiliana TaxID=1210884 RepID=A0A6P2DJP0_9BACT|nr:hypothetical protein [Gemmata massiliana]VTS00503.1 unnamed protein product [Gemmata massiliana]
MLTGRRAFRTTPTFCAEAATFQNVIKEVLGLIAGQPDTQVFAPTTEGEWISRLNQLR